LGVGEILTCAAARAFFPSARGLFCTATDILLIKSFTPLACTAREGDLLVVNRADDLTFWVRFCTVGEVEMVGLIDEYMYVDV